jgi:hypothetical protein
VYSVVQLILPSGAQSIIIHLLLHDLLFFHNLIFILCHSDGKL